jgi:hypothetical protein
MLLFKAPLYATFALNDDLEHVRILYDALSKMAELYPLRSMATVRTANEIQFLTGRRTVG